jgi:hypothetical protein
MKNTCLRFLDHSKQAEMQWLQDPNQSSVDNLSNVRCETSRHFRNKNKYLKAKTYELETNSKMKDIRDLCRGIIDFKKG